MSLVAVIRCIDCERAVEEAMLLVDGLSVRYVDYFVKMLSIRYMEGITTGNRFD